MIIIHPGAFEKPTGSSLAARGTVYLAQPFPPARPHYPGAAAPPGEGGRTRHPEPRRPAGFQRVNSVNSVNRTGIDRDAHRQW